MTDLDASAIEAEILLEHAILKFKITRFNFTNLLAQSVNASVSGICCNSYHSESPNELCQTLLVPQLEVVPIFMPYAPCNMQ